MVKISITELFGQVNQAARNSLKSVIEDSDVDYLIVLETQSKDRRQIIPAGANLDFRTPKDADGQIIGGMRATAYVDLKDTKSTPPTKATEPPDRRMNELEGKIKWLESKNYELERRVSSAKKQILTRNNIIEDLKKQVAVQQQTIKQFEANETPDSVDSGRSSYIEAAEEQLITKMNQYMEKEAELEQREEDLFYRERMLLEEEPKTGQTRIQIRR